MAARQTSTSTASATGNPRNKVALKPGRSLMDWIRLGHSGKDLTGVGGRVSEITIDQLRSHNRQDDAWICLKGRVYNVTHYMEYHPGGVDELMKGVGTDATALFNQVHQWVNGESMLSKCLVGHLDTSPLTMLTTTNVLTKVPDGGLRRRNSSVSVVVNPEPDPKSSNDEIKYHPCVLHSKEPVNHNTRLFRFHFQDGFQRNVPIGHHVHFKMVIQGMEVVRSYTPVLRHLNAQTNEEDNETNENGVEGGGGLYFMIKVYEKGTMTPLLDQLKPGESVEISEDTGNFQVETLDSYRHLVLLAAGTGFTPMVKLLHWVLFRTEDKNVKLMFFNKEEKDILWKSTLDSLAEQNPRLEMCYVLSEPSEKWEGPVGRLRTGLLEHFLPPPAPSKDTLCCVCGPVPFLNQALKNLEKLKFPLENVHSFTA